jgi:methionyl aminopeptidase
MIVLKTKAEIEKLSNSNKIIAELLDEVLPKYVKPGVSTFELDKIAEEFILSKGAKPGFKGYKASPYYPAFPATLCTSVNEQVVHGIPKRSAKLETGDIVSVDVGTLLDGYYGDAARTFAVGELSEEDKKLLKITKEALYKGIEQAKVGNRITDISHAIQVYAENEGYSLVRDYCGHGIGKNLHEDPQIPNFGIPNRGAKIEDGMVLAIEPMVNIGTHKVKTLSDKWTVVTIDKKKSAHFEHSVAIVDGKARILSQLD